MDDGKLDDMRTLRKRVVEHKIPEHLVAAPICTAAKAPELVPHTPGYYGIFIDDAYALPKPFQSLLVQRRTKLIYIGIATRSLYKRLVEQDLLHQGASTFFRGLGAILEFRPPPGSLAGKAKQNNYRFSVIDTTAIRTWIWEHLSVSWVEANPALKEVETLLIRKYFPIMNKDHNPAPVLELADLRRECRIIASTAVSGTDRIGI
jgi:hypothetical protein